MRALLLASALCAGTALQAEDTTMLVMDASGSMWGQIDGVNKVVIARDVVRDSLGAAAVTQSLGLIAYGHNRKGDCSDIEVRVPPAKGTNGAIAAAVAAINPKGMTPLTEAVRRAAAAMQHTENRATVVLVTDGLETCDADPCALARELEQSGVDFTAHVVGFGLSRADGAAVACLAEETGGRYFDAGNAGELAAALSVAVAEDIPQQAVVEEPPQVEPKHNLQINVQLTADSPPLELGQIDKLSLDLIRQSDGKTSRVAYEPYVALKAEPGKYIVRARYEGGEVDVPVSVEQFDTAHATMVLNAGVVDFQAIPLAPDLIDQRMISWEITNLATGQKLGRFEPELRSTFAPGRYEVRVLLERRTESAPAPVEVDIQPGTVSEGEFLLPHGALRLTPVDEAGGALPDGHVRFNLWTLKDDGTPDRMKFNANGAGKPLLALPGDYALVIEDWGIAKRKLTRPITIAPGSLTALQVVMPADASADLREVAQ